MEVDGFYETVVYYDENGDQNENRLDHFKLGLDWWHRYQNRIGSVNIGGKYYLVTHCRKVDHPYVDAADRTMGFAVRSSRGGLRVGYLVAHWSQQGDRLSAKVTVVRRPPDSYSTAD